MGRVSCNVKVSNACNIDCVSSPMGRVSCNPFVLYIFSQILQFRPLWGMWVATRSAKVYGKQLQVSSPMGHVSCNNEEYNTFRDEFVSSPMGHVSCNSWKCNNTKFVYKFRPLWGVWVATGAINYHFATIHVSSPMGRVSCNLQNINDLQGKKRFVPYGACELQHTKYI